MEIESSSTTSQKMKCFFFFPATKTQTAKKE